MIRHGNERLARDRWRSQGIAPFLADVTGSPPREHRRRSDAPQPTIKVDVETIARVRLPKVLAKLAVGMATDVIMRRRTYAIDGEPMQTAVSYVPWVIAESIPAIHQEDTGPGGLYARLEEAGYRIWRFREVIEVRQSTDEERVQFEMNGEPAPVVRIVRIAFMANGVPIELCDTFMRADRYTLVYEISPSGLPA